MMEILKLSLVLYGLTFLAASSAIFRPIRDCLRVVFSVMPNFISEKLVRRYNGIVLFETDHDFKKLDRNGDPVGQGYDFVSCRMCVGFWIALATIPFTGLSAADTFIAYAASYFLATQERP